MSTQRGNVSKSKAQKHQNRSVFKNNLHDGRKAWTKLNDMDISGVCGKCKEIVDWKIKYKKYKPLTQPKTCTVCKQKTVKKAYYTVCAPCSDEQKLCAKCGKHEHIQMKQDMQSDAEKASQQSQLEQELKFLTERQRRSFHRLQESGKVRAAVGIIGSGQSKNELVSEDDDDDQLSEDDDLHEDSVDDDQNQVNDGNQCRVGADDNGESCADQENGDDNCSGSFVGGNKIEKRDIDALDEKLQNELKT